MEAQNVRWFNVPTVKQSWSFPRRKKTELPFFFFLNIVCCHPLLFFYEVSLESKAIISDYSFPPALSPWFDPFPLLQHHPPSLRPAVPHLWINWAQWRDTIYFRPAVCTPKGHFRCLLFPALGSSSDGPAECFLMWLLCSLCFLHSKE